jgi:hypothetical protein
MFCCSSFLLDAHQVQVTERKATPQQGQVKKQNDSTASMPAYYASMQLKVPGICV